MLGAEVLGFDMEKGGSAAEIAELLARLSAPEMQYDHDWQLNDVLMSDNLALQHARRETSDFAGGARARQFQMEGESR